MKINHFLIMLCLSLISCQSNNRENSSQDFFIGTYTNAESKGIYKASIDADGNFKSLKHVASSENPSFLAYSNDKKYLVVVNETAPGSISSYRIEKDSLLFVDKIDSLGDIPCHIQITKNNYVITSNYMGGNVVLSKLDQKGKLTFLDSKKHKGSTSHPRQEQSHVHSTWINPKNRDVIAVDLGTNELWFYQIDKTKNKLISKSQQKLAMNSGAGPRHLAFHPKNPNWIYVLNELNATISLVIFENGVYELKSSVVILYKDFTNYNASADVHISKDGKFLYASNRGHNSIAILKIDSNTGELNLIDIQKIPGSWPRNFAFTSNDQYLVYANKWTNNLFSMKRDAMKGTLQITDSIKVPNPVMILF